MASMFRLVTLVILQLLLANQVASYKCDSSWEVCEIWLEVSERPTMMDGNTLVVVKDGLLFPYDTKDFSDLSKVISKEKVSFGIFH